MSLNINNLTGGAVQVKVDDVAVAHTRGGVTVNINPEVREQTVDQHGNTAVGVVHVGDSVRCTVPYVQWDAATLREMYEPGYDSTASSTGNEYLGVGRSAGFVYTARDLKFIPFVSTEQAKAIQFWRATPVGDLEIALTNEDDRILEREYVCMASPQNHSEGEFIGRLWLNYSP